ncbi:MAG TPA: hypothetical protein VLL52_10600 [Anaerolineae bacterium]|nr:hypothetical protein [Anaerolineae bacterium]
MKKRTSWWGIGLIIIWGLLVGCQAREPLPPLGFQPESLLVAQVRADYRTMIHVTDNETPVASIEIKEGELPPGLRFEYELGTGSAAIVGRPTQIGRYTFTVRAWCLGTNVSGQVGEKEYELVVE